ncbi:MAG: 4-hydroxythreonine-4-phosphate dehydrogenase PdxA [Rhodoferax sp.]
MAINDAGFKPLAITLGDPAGIGPEIIVKAYRLAPQLLARCVVVGDVATLRRAQQVVTGEDIPWPVVVLDDPSEVAAMPERVIPVMQVVPEQPPVPWGRVSAQAGQMAADCVVWAAEAALQGRVAGLVTAPLNKAALALAKPPVNGFPGHTELLQWLAARHQGVAPQDLPVRMMLANDALRVVLVTIHMSLRQALDALCPDVVLQTLTITHRALSAALGRAPRIGVAGVNPHAGEGGLFGREEIEVLVPAIARARALGLDVSDPQPPDTVFMHARGAQGKPGAYDVVVAMYHDQGLIPVKYLGVEQGVNVTLGLPLVRTSPDHGTAFDLAGTGRADASSLIAAVRMAWQMTKVQG